MYLLTAHVSLGFSCLIEGFIVWRNEPGGPAVLCSDVSGNVAKVAIHHTTNHILGDSIIVGIFFIYACEMEYAVMCEISRRYGDAR